MPRVFISYRRDDAAGSAGRLYDRLAQEFGADRVFIDVDSLQPGDDFVDAIVQTLNSCDVLVAIIGRRWLTATDSLGRRRLDQPGDYLRIELETALSTGIRTIPLLVERATMPQAEDLPPSLAPLARRHAHELRDTRWHSDLDALVDTLKSLPRSHAAPPADPRRARAQAQTSEASTIAESSTLVPPVTSVSDSTTEGGDTHAPESAPAIDLPAASGALARLQRELVAGSGPRDYALATAAGLLPILLAWRIGALADTPVPAGAILADVCETAGLVVLGYGSRANWWPYFAVLPAALFLLRFAGRWFYPLSSTAATLNRGLLLRIDEQHRASVGQRLAGAGLDRRNLIAALTLAAIINAIDMAELFRIYAAGIRGDLAACPREVDWTVHFLTGGSGIVANMGLTASAYANQFLLESLAIMLVVLLLRHNRFYLRSIYQRHRRGSGPEWQYIVLDFNDVERCFGLRVLHATFNVQIVLLIVGGVLLSASRVVNVPASVITESYRYVIGRLGGQTAAVAGAAPTLSVLFSDAGQVMVAIAWLVCFSVVAMPSAVKFLPLLHKHVNIVGRKEYLSEFVPARLWPAVDTQEALDALAAKFARSAFWPAGDERARALYTFAYFVFFFLLFPMSPAQGRYFMLHAAVLLILSILAMRLTFWAFRKALLTIDASLVCA